jgi:hypothetical protein
MKTVGMIQAHHRGWGGARDFSLARVGGKYAVEEVIARLKSMPAISDVIIAVPDDPGNQIFRDIAAEQCWNAAPVRWTRSAPISPFM